jgi:hypothetical protein
VGDHGGMSPDLLSVALAEMELSPRPLIFLVGHGGSGKSTLCRRLADELGGAVFEIDWYATYASKERKQRMYDAVASGDPVRIEAEENPFNWYSWEPLQRDLAQLKATGELTIRNAWDQCPTSGAEGTTKESTGVQARRLVQRKQATGLKVGSHDISVGDAPVFCDGIYLLHEPIIELADVVVLVDVDIDEARRRTEARDGHRSDAEYLEYKRSLVYKYEVGYFDRWQHNAHIRLDN